MFLDLWETLDSLDWMESMVNTFPQFSFLFFFSSDSILSPQFLSFQCSFLSFPVVKLFLNCFLLLTLFRLITFSSIQFLYFPFNSYPLFHSPFPSNVLLYLLQVSKVLQVLQDHLVQAQLRETEVTLGSQVFLAPLAGKENREAPEALASPVALVSKVTGFERRYDAPNFLCFSKRKQVN